MLLTPLKLSSVSRVDIQYGHLLAILEAALIQSHLRFHVLFMWPLWNSIPQLWCCKHHVHAMLQPSQPIREAELELEVHDFVFSLPNRDNVKPIVYAPRAFLWATFHTSFLWWRERETERGGKRERRERTNTEARIRSPSQTHHSFSPLYPVCLDLFFL